MDFIVVNSVMWYLFTERVDMHRRYILGKSQFQRKGRNSSFSQIVRYPTYLSHKPKVWSWPALAGRTWMTRRGWEMEGEGMQGPAIGYTQWLISSMLLQPWSVIVKSVRCVHGTCYDPWNVSTVSLPNDWSYHWHVFQNGRIIYTRQKSQLV